MTTETQIKGISGMPTDLVEYIVATGKAENRLFSAQCIQLLQEARRAREVPAVVSIPVKGVIS